MSPMRRRIAERLVEAQHTAALLTTFNEIDMSQVVALREEQREPFLERYGVKLGFMSFFVKAAIDALKQFPQVNAEIRGNEIVYHNYYDIGIAVGGGKGLVVPVLRNAERMSFAEIEIAIADFAGRARENKLSLDELKGGTFTISNGGVYGSLLSTPIVNPPQSGILGLHAIQERPVVRQRPGRDPADDVRGPDLRPPHRRRPRSRDLPQADQGARRAPHPDAPRHLRWPKRSTTSSSSARAREATSPRSARRSSA